MSEYRIQDWEDLQHYKQRSPPWIKLHYETLSSAWWVMLDNDSRVLATACMLLASRNDGVVDCSPRGLDYIRRVAYLPEVPDPNPLIDCGFLVPVVSDASGRKQMLASDSALAREAETEESREEAEESSVLSEPAEADVENSLEDGLKWNARLAPLAREAGGESKVADWLRRAKPKPDYYEEVLIGLVSMRERGAIDFLVKPGEPMSPAILSISQEGQPIERRAIAEYERLGRMPNRTNGISHISVGGAGPVARRSGAETR